MEVQGGTGRYREVQGGIGVYMEVQGGTGMYMEVHGGTGRYRDVQGCTGSYRDVQGGTWRYRDVQGDTGRYSVASQCQTTNIILAVVVVKATRPLRLPDVVNIVSPPHKPHTSSSSSSLMTRDNAQVIRSSHVGSYGRHPGWLFPCFLLPGLCLH